MKKQAFDDMVQRRMKNTGEDRATAERHIRAVIGEIASGQVEVVQQPDGTALLIQRLN